MHLTLTPQRGLPGQPEMTIHISDDTITIDGTTYDLSVVPEAGEGRPDGTHPFLAPIDRQNNCLHVHILARLGDDAEPHQDGPWVIETAVGNVRIPAMRKLHEEEGA